MKNTIFWLPLRIKYALKSTASLIDFALIFSLSARENKKDATSEELP